MEIDASIVLDELVHQFADPMAFFRELIQNAVDAGTREVVVHVSFEPSDQDQGRGRMTVEVRDYGEGMDRQIIEDELLKLFNSGKDRDLTKIGRFGIGFVSVFAVEPDAVCVDTGRTGESWRLIFDADRSYELYERQVPLEGTRVRLFKQLERREFEAFRDRAADVIAQWCKHVDVTIYFNDAEIGEPFDLDSICKVRMETEGTRIVAGYVERSEAPYGYYHSGLTLMEGVGGPWPMVSFKLDSRYLEHTLTRDQIIEDKNFHKALELLGEVVEEELPSKLVDTLERAVADGDLDRAERLAGILARLPAEASFWGRKAKLSDKERGNKAVFPVFGGPPMSADALRGADQVFWTSEESALVELAAREGCVIESRGRGIVALAREVRGGAIERVEDVFVMVDALEASGSEKRLAGHLSGLAQIGHADIRVGRFFGAREAASRPWLGLRRHERLARVEDLGPSAIETLRRADVIVLNRDHELVRAVVRAAEKRPEWAALLLVTLTCPDATADDPGADALLRRAFDEELGRA